MEMLRRFQSEPVLANPRLESGNFKIKSDLRQSILHRHRHVTPMSDKRHPIRSTTIAQKQQHASTYQIKHRLKLQKKKRFHLYSIKFILSKKRHAFYNEIPHE
jgi:hypothetical protein